MANDQRESIGTLSRGTARCARQHWLSFMHLCLCAAVVALGVPEATVLADQKQASDAVKKRVVQLVRDLNHEELAQRDRAEKALLRLSGVGDPNARPGTIDTDVLQLLPRVDDRMPPEVKHRLTRIRQTIQRAAAEAAVAQTSVELSVKDLPLNEILAAIERQTANRLIYQPENFGAGVKPPKVSVDIGGVPFWQALDEVLDLAKLDVSDVSGQKALSVQQRMPDRVPRAKSAAYAGPFRIEATEVHAHRNLRRQGQQALRITLQVAWEPRLRPIRVAQALAEIQVVDPAGQSMQPGDAETNIEIPLMSGYQATDLQIPLTLPERSVKRIASLQGKLRALVPGREETFEFEQLDKAKNDVRRRGGVVVTLVGVRKNGEIWDLHMTVAFDESSDALASHFDWVYQNISYLVGDDGQPLDYVGIERSHESESEVGLIYSYELPEGATDLRGLKWVYRTPAAIVELPVDYELKDIPLP